MSLQQDNSELYLNYIKNVALKEYSTKLNGFAEAIFRLVENGLINVDEAAFLIDDVGLKFMNINAVKSLETVYMKAEKSWGEAAEYCNIGKYLSPYDGYNGKKYKTLQEAIKICLSDSTSGGITREADWCYSVRKGTELKQSSGGEISWIKKDLEETKNSYTLQSLHPYAASLMLRLQNHKTYY